MSRKLSSYYLKRAGVLFVLILAVLSCNTPSATPSQPAPAATPVQGETPVQTSQPIQATSTIQTPPTAQTQEPSQPPPNPTEPPAKTQPPGETPFTLQRITAIVKAGLSTPLPKIEGNQPVAFPFGSTVTVSVDGEALLLGTLEGQQCKIHVFFDTRLQKKSCPKSTFNGSNVSCVEDGSAVFEHCANMLVQTPTAEFQLTGTWVEVSYRRPLQASVLVVSEGQVQAYPVTNANNYRRGDMVMVGQGEFLYTAPDAMLPQAQVPNIEPRQAQDWDSIPALLQTYDIMRWYRHGSQYAKDTGVPFPDLGGTSGPADLIISLESRKANTTDQRLMASNPGSIGVPVRATVTNQGGEPADPFKIAVEGTGSDGTYVRAFTVPGQTDLFYPHTSQPMDPNDVVSFDGVVFFPGSLAGQTVKLVAQADSCSGVEFAPADCAVSEADEGNNSSDPLQATLSSGQVP